MYLLVVACLQRWALILSAYNYDVEFQPTQQPINANKLSRLLLQQLQDSQIEESEVSILNISQLDKLPVTQNELQIATRRDPKLSQVVSFTKCGSPSDVGIE